MFKYMILSFLIFCSCTEKSDQEQLKILNDAKNKFEASMQIEKDTSYCITYGVAKLKCNATNKHGFPMKYWCAGYGYCEIYND